jgi:glutamate mutase epsilon subunit
MIVDGILVKCIDTYSKQRVKNTEGKSQVCMRSVLSSFQRTRHWDMIRHVCVVFVQEVIDERLERIVNRMFDRCFHDGEYKQAMGVAMESRRLDIVKQSILQSGSCAELV